MKQFLRFAALVACACLFAGCGSSPESVVLKYHKAMAKGNFEEAEKCVTGKEAKGTIKRFKSDYKTMDKVDKKWMAQKTFKTISCVVDGKEARVTVKIISDGEDELVADRKTHRLEKGDDGWKITEKEKRSSRFNDDDDDDDDDDD